MSLIVVQINNIHKLCLDDTYYFRHFLVFFYASLDQEMESPWMSIGTFGEFWHQTYDERTICMPVMRRKEQQKKILDFMDFFHTSLLFALPVYYLSEGFTAHFVSFES